MTEITESPSPRLLHTRYGNLSAPVGTSDLITDFLEHYGEWASLEVEYLAPLLPPKARILDIGAYVGTFALGLAQTANAAFVAMVEGNPAIAPHLAANAARNLRCEHEVLNALVVNSNAPLVETGWADPDNAGSASFGEQASGRVRVPLPDTTIGFKTLVERFRPLDLVKLDVEGMEEQLLADHPLLRQDKSVLLWLECNESRSSLSLAKMLLDVGRPVTYFAWPSHNPDNYRGASRKIFPFAYEAGLLLGADPTPLTPKQNRAGCLVKSIHTVEDLKEALWLTPRWAPREWDVLDRNEIAAIATHLLLGKRREDFLTEAESMIEGVPQESAATKVGVEPDRHGRLGAFKDAKIAQLESKLAELSSRNLDLERVKKPAVVSPDGNEMRMRELHQAQLAELVGQIDESRELHKLQTSQRDERIAALAGQVTVLAETLNSIQRSLTWRIALRLSRTLGRIPFLRRIVRRMLRHKTMEVQP